MSRDAFPRFEREYNEALEALDIARQERREMQRERAIDCAMELAYEQTDLTADCLDINRIN